MNRRFLGPVLGLALFGAAAAMPVAHTFAAPPPATDDFVITAAVGDVLTLSLSPNTDWSFGSPLNFLGANANYGSCANTVEGGATYFGLNTGGGGISATVQSNQSWTISRVNVGTIQDSRLYVNENAWVDCATNHANRIEFNNGDTQAPGPSGTHLATAGTTYNDTYTFDVRVADDDSTSSATITYSAVQS